MQQPRVKLGVAEGFPPKTEYYAVTTHYGLRGVLDVVWKAVTPCKEGVFEIFQSALTWSATALFHHWPVTMLVQQVCSMSTVKGAINLLIFDK